MSFADNEKNATSDPAMSAVKIKSKSIITPNPICAFEFNVAVRSGVSKFVYAESGSKR